MELNYQGLVLFLSSVTITYSVATLLKMKHEAAVFERWYELFFSVFPSLDACTALSTAICALN